uniref:RNase H type-1 domain-containing protein n=1 Tax=Nelumbo nucifera TaxID=4432 RepID=A0A822XSR9_NELNU|nr:TPA_asm: hypothetical protein HUJ06_023409 [Nelumbo nucifera]
MQKQSGFASSLNLKSDTSDLLSPLGHGLNGGLKMINERRLTSQQGWQHYSPVPNQRSKSFFWSPPRAGVLKINVDRSFVSKGKAGFGVAIRDPEGKVVAALFGNCTVSSPIQVEAFAAVQALKTISVFDGFNFCLESDCLNLVNAINKGVLELA